MRRASGVILILAGLGVAAQALTGPNSGTIDKGGNGPGRSDSAGAVNDAIVPGSLPAAHVPKATPPARASARMVRQSKVDAARKKTGRRVVVIDGTSRTPVGRSATSSGRPLDRVGLTRELQKHLRRVGCYGGRVSGVWTPSTRRAMKEFTDRMNATLPVDQPDRILLAMLESQDHKACGPAAVVAAGAKQAPGGIRPASGATPPVSESAASTEPIPGRMALAGPKAEDERAAAAKAARRARRARTSRYRESKPFGPWIFRERMGW